MAFWETHSITEEFLEKTEEVSEDERPRRPNRTRPINVRFDDFTIRRLKEFVVERLYEEEKREGLLPKS